MNFLDFERPIADLEAKIEELRYVADRDGVDINEEISRLQRRKKELIRQTFATLNPWKVVQLARHPDRPHTMDYLSRIFSDFEELHGDRCYADDPALIGGLARLKQHPVLVLGQEKGRNTTERVARNFGMARPEGYRKARRLMRLAERFNLPVICFIDTAGAYPGVEAEQRNQHEAIASNLALMCTLTVPLISVVIGEGGSGGALALGVADRIYMQEYSIYSVISPEGCASILWKNADQASLAAQALVLDAPRLHKMGFIDGVIAEPLGGAHRDVNQAAQRMQEVLEETLFMLQGRASADLAAERCERFSKFGFYRED